MVIVVNCQAGVLGSNPGGPKDFSLWNFFNGVRSVVTVPFLTALLLGLLFSDMVRVVDCHAGVLGSNPGGPRIFSPWNSGFQLD